MATKKAKPNGQFELTSNHVEEYFMDVEVSELPGVGYSTTHKLKQLNWKTCSDLLPISLARLQQEVGNKFGTTLYQFCRGIDIKPLVFDQIRKSVSTEVNYGIRFTKQSELETFLKQLCTEVHSRLTEIKRRGKSITLKYMVRADEAPIETVKFMGHGICDNVTKTVTLNNFTDDLEVILRTVLSIKGQLNVPPADLRGIGIHISKLDGIDDNSNKPNVLKSLFDKVAEKNLQGKAVMEKSNVQCEENVRNDRVLRTSTEQAKSVNKKSSRGRGRGRGCGATGSRVLTRSANGVRNGSNMFTVIEERHEESEISNLYEDLDMDVLAELPDEIREEVLREHKAKPKKGKKTGVDAKKAKDNEIDAEFLAALPPDIRKEVLQQQRANSKVIEKLVKTSPTLDTNSASNDNSEKMKPVKFILVTEPNEVVIL